jgi:hypothetical protein
MHPSMLICVLSLSVPVGVYAQRASDVAQKYKGVH